MRMFESASNSKGHDFLTQRLLAQKGLVWVKPGSDRFRPIVHPLNLDPDPRFGSGNSLNLGPNLGPVQAGSGSNRSSEPDRGITIIDCFGRFFGLFGIYYSLQYLSLSDATILT